MAKHVLSIEIGQQVTKVIEIDYRKKNPHVYRAVTFATPEDVMDDGFIRDRDTLAVAFREQLQTAGIKEKAVVFSIASTKIATREVTLPDVKENKVGSLVAATAQDYFPVDLTNYSVAYSILDSVKDDSGSKSLKVMLLAAPDSLVDNYYNFADTMGFSIESIDYFGSGSMQVLKSEIVGSYCACVQISGNNSTVTIMNEGQQLMQRTVSYGVFTMAESIVQDSENGINDLDSACDALTRERLLCNTLDYEGLEATESARMTDTQYASEVEHQAARKVATDACGDLIMSVIRVLDFFRSQNPGIQLNGLYLTGMGVKVNGIDDLFSSEINIPIHKMEHLVSVTFPRKFGDSLYNQTEYIAVIGAAINPVGFKSNKAAEKGMGGAKINMVPFWIVLGVAVVAGIAMSAISVGRYMSAEKKNTDLKNEKESLSYIEGIYNTNESIKTLDSNINTMYKDTHSMNEYMSDLIIELEDKLPSACKIDSLSINDEGINMSVTSKTDLQAAKLIMNLEKDYDVEDPATEVGIAGLTDIQCPGITHNEEEKTWTYSISARFVNIDVYDSLVESDGRYAMASKDSLLDSKKADGETDEESDVEDETATDTETTDDATSEETTDDGSTSEEASSSESTTE
ncbi:MAG: pilus assembly protein PilM [Lachnospiraceae bacterium]|nr:pilus assembly protein PilM [Lachnospiraceae bacterium]